MPSPTRETRALPELANALFPVPRSIILRHRVPVHHVPPRFDVIRPAVLVFEIISVLPNIDAEDRRVAVHQGAILVWRRNNFELSVLILDQPRPAAAKTARTSRGKFFFEIIKAAECRFDVISELAFRLATSVRPHDFPEKGMIRVPTTVVAHDCANVFRHRFEIADQIFY